jgi:hypothetical protein
MSEYRGQPLNPTQFREVASRVEEKRQQEIREAEEERIARIAAQSNHKEEIPPADFNPGERANPGVYAVPDTPPAPTNEVAPVPEAGLLIAPTMVQQLKVAGFAVGGGVLVGIALAYVIKQARKVEGDSSGS